MAKTGSFIKLDRGLKNNSLWLERPFSKGQAWVDLLILSQGVDKEKVYKGKTQIMERGKVYTSVYFLSNRWGWSRNKVYRFLQDLVHDEMIAVKGWIIDGTIDGTNNGTIKRTNNDTKNGTIITIENWEFYQDSESNNGTNNGTKKRTKDGKKTEPTIERQRKKEKDKENKGRSAPVPPSGVIPEMYRDMFKTYEEYIAWRNQ